MSCFAFMDVVILVIIGDHNVKRRKETDIEISRNVEQFIAYPRYKKTKYNYDIALIKLDKGVNLLVYTPVCLPGDGWIFRGRSQVYGWGRDESGMNSAFLQKVTVPIVDNRVCRGAAMRSTVEKNREITDDMMCAGKVGKDACRGDSGGPMSMGLPHFRRHHFLVGVVSWGEGCAKTEFFGVYSRVSYFVDWIQETMATNGGARFCSYRKKYRRRPRVEVTLIPLE